MYFYIDTRIVWFAHVSVYIHAHTWTHIYILYTHTYIITYTYIHMIYIYLHVCIYTYMYVYIHIQIYICTHVSRNNTCMYDSWRIRPLSVDRHNKPPRRFHQVSAVFLRNTLEQRQWCCLHAGPAFQRWISYGQKRLFVYRFLQECHVSGRDFPTCVNEQIFEWVMAHILTHVRLRHIIYAKVLCRTYKWAYNIWNLFWLFTNFFVPTPRKRRISHVAHMNELCRTCERVTWHILIRHVTHMNESCRTYSCVICYV